MSLDTPGLWAVTAPPAPLLKRLSADASADIAIVGGGFTGLSAALNAARRGADVALLEADEIGAGGSGRNFGLVNAGMWLPPADLEARLDPGNPLPGLLADAPAAVWALIAKNGMACEARPEGTVHCAPDQAGADALSLRARQWRERGVPVRLLDASQTAKYTGTTAFFAAVFDPRAGTVQPLAYARGLARVAQAAGARLFVASPVTTARRDAGCWHLQTPGGTLRARTVIWAGNVYGIGPATNTAVSVLPYFSFATDPLPADLRAGILPGAAGAWDTAKVLTSFRLDAAGRFVIGSVGRLGAVDTRIHEGWARRRMATLFPHLAGQRFAHRWFGRIGTTPDAIPRLVEHGDGAFGLTGYNGRGIAPGTVLGKALADAALGHGPLPALRPARPDRLRGVKTLGIRAGAAALHLVQRR